MGLHKKHLRFLLFVLAVPILVGGILAAGPKKSEAFIGACIPPAFCPGPTVLGSAIFAEAHMTAVLMAYHEAAEVAMLAAIKLAFEAHEQWLVNVFFKQYILPTMQNMTQQLNVVTMHQTAMMGMFLDAKQQLETQRLFQELQVEAQRDYQPSEDFCWFGTAARSLSATESASHYKAAALDARQMKRHLRNKDIVTSFSPDQDKLARFEQFKKNYCSPSDNNYNGKGTGMEPVCQTAGPRPNMDIDFTRLIEDRRTLDVSFAGGAVKPDEEDVLALGNNLYGHKTLERYDLGGGSASQNLYLALRALTAKRNLAENSYNSIVALKSSGSDDMSGAANTSKYLGAILTELGVPKEDIEGMIGKNPSYYAQLEVLAKKIYQNPDFFANLYDTPANVARKSVALKAIDLMLDRAIYESQLRQEMITSVLLAHRLRGEFQRAGSELTNGKGGQ